MNIHTMKTVLTFLTMVTFGITSCNGKAPDTIEKKTTKEVSTEEVQTKNYHHIIKEFVIYLKKNNIETTEADLYNSIVATSHLLKEFKIQLDTRTREYEVICEEFLMRGNDCGNYEDYIKTANNQDPIKNPLIPAVCDFGYNGNNISLGYYSKSETHLTEEDPTAAFWLQTGNLMTKCNTMLSYLEYLMQTNNILTTDTKSFVFKTDKNKSIAMVKALIMYTISKLPEKDKGGVFDQDATDYLDNYVSDQDAISINGDIQYWKNDIKENYDIYNVPANEMEYID